MTTRDSDECRNRELLETVSFRGASPCHDSPADHNPGYELLVIDDAGKLLSVLDVQCSGCWRCSSGCRSAANIPTLSLRSLISFLVRVLFLCSSFAKTPSD